MVVVVEDDEVEVEDEGEDGGVKVGWWRNEDEDFLKDFKGVWMINFWTFFFPSLGSNKGFEYKEKISSSWAEVDGKE